VLTAYKSVSYSLSGEEAGKVMETLHEVFCDVQGKEK